MKSGNVQANGLGNRHRTHGERSGHISGNINLSRPKLAIKQDHAPKPEPSIANKSPGIENRAAKPPAARRPSGPTFRTAFLNVKGCETVEELIGLAHGHGELSPQNLSAFWSRIGQLAPRKRGEFDHTQEQLEAKRQLEKIFEVTVEGVDGFNSKGLSELILGMAKVVKHARAARGDGTSERRYGIFQQILLRRKLGSRGDVFQSAANASARLLPTFCARHLSNLAYAYAIARYLPMLDDGSNFFDQIAKRASMCLRSFKPQELSNLLWAFATVGAPQSNLFKKVVHVIEKQDMAPFKPQELSNIAWAYAKSGEHGPRIFDKLEGEIIFTRDLKHFEPQNLSNIAWAYATAGGHNPHLFNKVEAAIISRDLKPFEEQALSNIVWAYATAGVSSPRLFKKVADAIIIRELGSFMPQALSNIVWAFATAKQCHPGLFDKVSEAAIAKQSGFTTQETANLLWAHAAMGRADKHLFLSFLPTVLAQIEECKTQELTNIGWAFAVSNVDAPDLFDDKFITALYKKDTELLNEDQLRQLHQWQLWQQELQSNVHLPSNLQKRCFEVFSLDLHRCSSFQSDVVRTLRGIGLRPKEEVLMGSGYRLDAVVGVHGKMIGVEVDGPFHFNCKKPAGNTILKKRQVFNVDKMSIVSVPYWDWDKLGDNCTRKQEYLRAKLGLLQNAWRPRRDPWQCQTAKLLNGHMPYSKWSHLGTSAQKAGLPIPQA